jgi:hypothetical protein
MRVRAKKVRIDGILFDSKHEGEVYVQLKQLQREGKIHQLQCHTVFRFVVNDVKIGMMKPDFTFVDTSGIFFPAGAHAVLDAKGFSKSKKTGKMLPRVNREFGLKTRLLRALFGLEVKCI